MKKQEFKKNEERLSNLQDNFKPLNHRATRRRRRRARNRKLISTNNEGKLPQSGKGNRLPGSPESPKEVRPKEEHLKTHHH